MQIVLLFQWKDVKNMFIIFNLEYIEYSLLIILYQIRDKEKIIAVKSFSSIIFPVDFLNVHTNKITCR